MTPEEWFDRLRAALPATDGIDLTVGERDALLDLARVSAHTSERWTAPLTTFMAGVALGARGAGERERVLRDLVDRLEGSEDPA